LDIGEVKREARTPEEAAVRESYCLEGSSKRLRLNTRERKNKRTQNYLKRFDTIGSVPSFHERVDSYQASEKTGPKAPEKGKGGLREKRLAT